MCRLRSPSPRLAIILLGATIAACAPESPTDPGRDAASEDTDNLGEDTGSADTASADITDADASVDVATDADASVAFVPQRGIEAVVTCLRDAACDEILVVAHRGAHDVVPENSLASIRRAAEVGADLVELDVRSAADGTLVVIHDSTVDRTTDGSGEVASLSLEELQALTLRGSSEDPETHTIPTLGACLEVALDADVVIYLDVKTSDTAQIVDTLVAEGAVGRVLVREEVHGLADMIAREPTLMPLAPWDDGPLSSVLDAVPTAVAVEITRAAPVTADAEAIRDAGRLVQQDVIAGGDLLFDLQHDPQGWLDFVDAGVTILQTNLPADLARTVRRAASPP